MNNTLPLQISDDTLLMVSCSGKKKSGNLPSSGPSIRLALNPSRANELANAQAALCTAAQVDEKTLMPAYLRYSGFLYERAATTIGTLVAAGRRVVIVSGGYGLLLADEPIGWYEKKFIRSNWPHDLLEKCILDYVNREGIRSVIAVMSSEYAKLVERVNWRAAGVNATLVSPIADGKGNMMKVPRAQGEAINTLISAGLDQAWRSSDGLSLQFKIL